MGREGNNKNYKGNKKATKEDKAKRAEEWKNSSGGDRRKSWNEIQLESPIFNAFYKTMDFIDEGDEWDNFIKHLKAPLPACFRINSDYAYHEQLAHEVMGYAGKKITLDKN